MRGIQLGIGVAWDDKILSFDTDLANRAMTTERQHQW